jgi:hypothetical protein
VRRRARTWRESAGTAVAVASVALLAGAVAWLLLTSLTEAVRSLAVALIAATWAVASA